MNIERIKEELRRSALEDKNPIFQCSHIAWATSWKWRVKLETFKNVDHCRMFFLFIAEAL